jgi:prevent-host-death family protein
MKDARNKLAEVVDAALQLGPQVVTRRGVETVVVLSYRDYVRVASVIGEPRLSFERFLQAIPGVSAGVVAIERIPIAPRDADL